MEKNNNEIIISEEESKICKIDGKKFDSSRKMIWYVRKKYKLSFEDYIIKCYYNNIRPTCLKTGNHLKFKGNKFGPWFSNYSKNNFRRKPHTDKTKEKIKNSCKLTFQKKYGVDNIFQTNECKQKIKDTIREKYGVDNIMQLENMKKLFSTFEKSNESIINTKITNSKKYGKDHLFKTNEYKLKLRSDLFNRYYKSWDSYLKKISNFFSINCKSSYDDLINQKPLSFICQNCQSIWDQNIKLIPMCDVCSEKDKFRSNLEKSFNNWLQTICNIKVDSNKRFSDNDTTFEADFIINDKIIIELNGLYWHGELNGNKKRNYHLNKLKFFNKLGYEVINIFEDEWLFKTEIVKSKILHKLKLNRNKKIYARNCNISFIKNKNSNDFLLDSHIQGPINASICIGAFYQDSLVATMTFSKIKSRKIIKTKDLDDSSYELVRFSTDIKYNVVGIAGKLLNFFIRKYNPNKIITYADKRWTTSIYNNLYTQLNFEFVSESNPSYWYTKKYLREYRYKFRKCKLVENGYDPNKTEWQIMQENGYDRIWDCGHIKYELTIQSPISLHRR
tara:strand:- start:809 stop:2488 length:1680 start_codon:yes stop_codon:yes gene_type:complete